jgi:hypothetical protein
MSVLLFFGSSGERGLGGCAYAPGFGLARHPEICLFLFFLFRGLGLGEAFGSLRS